MKTTYEIKLGNKTYTCILKKETHCFSLSCDDEHGNEVGFSSNVDEDTYKIIKLMLFGENVEITELSF